MLLAIKAANEISQKASHLISERKICDFRISIEFDMSLSCYIVLCDNKDTDHEVEKQFEEYSGKCIFEYLAVDIKDDDPFLKSIFKNSDHILYNARRSLSNLLSTRKFKVQIKSPVVSFYSYKGGVGRTTGLALFAAHLSNHHGKKIFILDCDFEAPGLINFFGISETGVHKNGIVEYIKNKEFDDTVELNDEYVYELSSEYSGDGSIYLMTAGNVFGNQDRKDYLEGLSRLDLFSSDDFIARFSELLSKINDKYEPDIILIDSRTGFNDVYGVLAHCISDVVVGFFGLDMQNIPGLYQFIDNYIENAQHSSVVLVRSIISRSFSSSLRDFSTVINDYISEQSGDELTSAPAITSFGFMRHSVLEDIGTSQSELEDFVELVKNKSLEEYVKCFEFIHEFVSDVKNNSDVDVSGIDINGSVVNSDACRDDILSKYIYSKFYLKENILVNLKNNLPELYAEDIVFSENYLRQFFYIRRPMEDIFLDDKFMLLGGKGTGKTFFYRALQDDVFFQNLKRRAQKINFNYKVISAITLATDRNSSQGFFEISNFEQSKISDPDYFYKRFWTVYIWCLLSDQENGRYSIVQKFPIFNDADTARKFKEYIYDDQKFSIIEKITNEIDDKLNLAQTTCILTFDQLDMMAKPFLWPKVITPLINLCATMRFKRIRPKLFLRRDLYLKLGNITNKNQLERRCVNIEWTMNEIFDFFFKIIFSTTKDAFLDYVVRSNQVNQHLIRKIKQTISREYSYNQLNADEYLLKPLVNVFFGKNAAPDGGTRYGESYDWFYSNLRNADGTISLRPFLDLIKYQFCPVKKRPKARRCCRI